MKCEAYSSLEGVTSDHRKVLAKIHMSLCRNKKWTVKTTCYDWPSFTNRYISNRYKVTAWNKFYTFQEKSERYTLNDEYENFISAHIEAAAKCIPTKPRAKCRVPLELIVVRKNLMIWKKHPY